MIHLYDSCTVHELYSNDSLPIILPVQLISERLGGGNQWGFQYL